MSARPGSWKRPLVIVAIYLVLFVLLDEFSLIFKTTENITPWFPPAGLRLALILACGLAYAPLIMLDMLIHFLWFDPMTVPLWTLLIYAPIPMIVYSIAAVYIRSGLKVDLHRGAIPDVLRFIVMSILAPLAAAVIGMLYFTVVGVTTFSDFFSLLQSWWLDDIVGVVSLTPVLVLAGTSLDRMWWDSHDQPFPLYLWKKAQSKITRRHLLEVCAQLLAGVLVLHLVFYPDHLHLYYCLFFPLAWATLRFGLPGAATSVLLISIGSMSAIRILNYPLASTGELQLLILSLSIGGLLLGAAVNERNASERLLRLREENFRSLIENATDVIAILDSKGIVRYASPSFESILGYQPDEIIGRQARALLDTQTNKTIAGWLKEGKDWNTHAPLIRGQVRHQDGTWRVMEGVGQDLLDSPAVAGIVINARDVTERAQAETMLKELLKKGFDAHEAERTRIARELHDGINQILFSALLSLESAHEETTGMSRTYNDVGRGKRLVSEAIEEIQHISRNLQPCKLEDLGLWPAIRELCDDAGQRSQLDFKLDCHCVPEDLDHEIELTIYRITQEALSNIEKHSHARRVEVVLETEEGWFNLEIADDGVGFDPAFRPGPSRTRSGLGLINIRERAEYLGGRVRIKTAPGHGTYLNVRLPLADVGEKIGP